VGVLLSLDVMGCSRTHSVKAIASNVNQPAFE
jgi:hypothetical protein